MSARKKKSLLFGTAPDTTIFHSEHRSKKGRKIRNSKQMKSLKLKKIIDKIKKYEDIDILGGV